MRSSRPSSRWDWLWVRTWSPKGLRQRCRPAPSRNVAVAAPRAFYTRPPCPRMSSSALFASARNFSSWGKRVPAGREPSDSRNRRLSMGVAILALACVSLPVQSSPPMQFTRLTAEDGLSQGAVMAMLEDSQGFLWIGTEDGLDRYDGYDIHRYVHDRMQPSSLPDDWVSTLVQDRTGTLWIGTEGGGVVGRNPNTGALVRLGPTAGESGVAANEHVRLLFIDRDGRLCIATRDHGLVVVDRAPGAARRFRSDASDSTTLSSDSVLAIAQDAKGSLWLGTR